MGGVNAHESGRSVDLHTRGFQNVRGVAESCVGVRQTAAGVTHILRQFG